MKKSQVISRPHPGQPAQPFTRVRRRGQRVSLMDVEAIADLCAKRASEAEACAVLGISYSTWCHFKIKPHNAAQYGETLSRIKGAKIQAHLNNIEAHAANDWRASEAYIEKVMPERFGPKAGGDMMVITPVVIAPDRMEELTKLVKQNLSKSVIDVTPLPLAGPSNP